MIICRYRFVLLLKLFCLIVFALHLYNISFIITRNEYYIWKLVFKGPKNILKYKTKTITGLIFQLLFLCILLRFVLCLCHCWLFDCVFFLPPYFYTSLFVFFLLNFVLLRWFSDFLFFTCFLCLANFSLFFCLFNIFHLVTVFIYRSLPSVFRVP